MSEKLECSISENDVVATCRLIQKNLMENNISIGLAYLAVARMKEIMEREYKIQTTVNAPSVPISGRGSMN